jgi:hypothetical protein
MSSSSTWEKESRRMARNKFSNIQLPIKMQDTK